MITTVKTLIAEMCIWCWKIGTVYVIDTATENYLYADQPIKRTQHFLILEQGHI